MSTRSITRLLTILAAFGILVAGCGDGTLSKSEYIDQNNTIQKELASSISDLNTIDPNNKSAAASGLLDIQKKLNATIKKLDALAPPKDWTDEHADILKALNSSSDEIGNMATAVKKGDSKAFEASRTKLITYNTNFTTAVNSINSSR